MYLYTQDDDEWIDVNHSSDEEVNGEDSTADADQSAESSATENDDDDNDDDDDDDDEEKDDDDDDDDHDDDDDDDDDNEKEEEKKEQKENNEKSDNNSTLSCNKETVTFPVMKNGTENDCETNSGKEQISQKKNVLTKQQKKTQKLEKKAKLKTERKEELTAEKKAKASLISAERLFTDEDFKKIDVALVKREVTYAKRGVKRTHDQIETEKQSGELVKLSDIENIYKKRKHDKTARIESVKVRR